MQCGRPRRFGFHPSRRQLRLGISPVPVDLIAGKTKVMPDEFISSTSNGVTEAFHRYLARPCWAPTCRRRPGWPARGSRKILKA